MAKPVTVKDGKEYNNKESSDWFVSVISGTPSMKFSLDDFANESTIDLTVSASYPNATVTLPEGKFRFDLSGAVVQIAQL